MTRLPLYAYHLQEVSIITAALPVRDLLNRKHKMLAGKVLVALTALKRLESERGLTVHESTRDQVRRALETAGILFGESDRGRVVMLFNERAASRPGRGLRAQN